jgi:hypothetical protein
MFPGEERDMAVIKNVPTIFEIEKARKLAGKLAKEEREAGDGWTYLVEPPAEKAGTGGYWGPPTVAKIGVYDDEDEFVGYL